MPPVLLAKLRLALNYLYETPPLSHISPSNEVHPSVHREEAHEFLLSFKSSNVRRYVVSRLQSKKDKVVHQENDGDLTDWTNHDAGGNVRYLIGNEDSAGSVYLACLALLLQDVRRECESHVIFAAQTLNHRCRSIKICESLDIEAEDGVECGVARIVLAWEQMRPMDDGQGGCDAGRRDGCVEKSNVILTAWLERYVPLMIRCCGDGDESSFRGSQLLSEVLQQHAPSLLEEAEGMERGEERIKGTLTLLTLSVAMYVSAFRQHQEEYSAQQDPVQAPQQQRAPWANAVLSELGSALSVTALRIRYRPTPHSTPHPTPRCPPLVDMVVQSIQSVADVAKMHLGRQTSPAPQMSPPQPAKQLEFSQKGHEYALQRCIAATLTALPETLLLPPGAEAGHRCPSVDRACLRAASMELRAMGVLQVWNVLTNAHAITHQDDAHIARILECFESWARFVPIPLSVIQTTVGTMAVKYLHANYIPSTPLQSKAQTAAHQYLVSLFEAASHSLTPETILAAALGVGGCNRTGTTPKSGKKTLKKQGRSKKRHEARIDKALQTQETNNEGGSDDAAPPQAARNELLARKNAACAASAALFGISTTMRETPADDNWGLRHAAVQSSRSYPHETYSTLSSCASSVLPHLLWLQREDTTEDSSEEALWRLKLFSILLLVLRRMCEHGDRNVRALAYEPLMILHSSLNSVEVVRWNMERVAVDAICECTLALATSCGYPTGYFHDLSTNNDEELEIERNDVRDVARSVSSLESGNFGTDEHKSPSILILDRIVTACHDAILPTKPEDLLPPETAVHTLSALAKPLNKLGNRKRSFECAVVAKALQALGNVCERLNRAFDISLPLQQILPVSRLALMGTSSLSPLFSSLAERISSHSLETSWNSSDEETRFKMLYETTLRVALRCSIVSAARIPELVTQSTLDTTRYDIKGAMRGPGGEDHVGCIALMKISFESDAMARAMLNVYGSTNILHDLSSLYQGLKVSEQERGPGCDYGKGVTPKSRRLILNALSRLAIVEMNHGSSPDAKEGKLVLHQLLHAPLSEIGSQREVPMSSEKLFRTCEAAFDLASFSPELIVDLFSNPSEDLGSMIECVVSGYSGLSFTANSDALCEQWGRLRGGVLEVLRACSKHAMTNYSAEAITALVKAECEAAMQQCNQGHQSTSNLFNDSVIGEEMLHSGAFLMLVAECVNRIGNDTNAPLEKKTQECQECLRILKNSAPVLIPLFLHHSPEASCHLDPRPTIAEAWFLTMASLVSICRKDDHIAASLLGDGIEALFGDSISTAITLVFLKDLGNKKTPPPVIQRGMSLDGPQTLAMMEFATEAMALGPSILAAAAMGLSAHLPLHPTSENPSADLLGAAILSAGLLRAASGALPPWAVEGIPTLLRSMYGAFGKDCDGFIRILTFSTELRVSASFGGLDAGQKLAARYFEKISSAAMNTFLTRTREACMKGEWKRLKVILKQVCGGKKKDAGFNLKPQYTNWECDRI